MLIKRLKSFISKKGKDKCLVDVHDKFLPGMAFKGEHGQRMYYVGPCLGIPELATIDTQKHFWKNNLGTYPLELMRRDAANDLPYWSNFWGGMTAIELHESGKAADAEDDKEST